MAPFEGSVLLKCLENSGDTSGSPCTSPRSAGGTFCAQVGTAHLLLARQPPALPVTQGTAVTVTATEGWGQGEQNRIFPWGRESQLLQNHTNHRVLWGSREQTKHEKLLKYLCFAAVSCPALAQELQEKLSTSGPAWSVPACPLHIPLLFIQFILHQKQATNLESTHSY